MNFEPQKDDLVLLANAITVVGGIAGAIVLTNHALGIAVLIATIIVFLALRQK